MIIPVQITFRGMQPSDAIAARIREKADKLDRFHARITTARVMFEQLHRRHHQGNLFHVRIDVTLPGGEVAVGNEHHDQKAHADPYVAIRDAFDSVKRKIDDHADRITVVAGNDNDLEVPELDGSAPPQPSPTTH